MRVCVHEILMNACGILTTGGGPVLPPGHPVLNEPYHQSGGETLDRHQSTVQEF